MADPSSPIEMTPSVHNLQALPDWSAVPSNSEEDRQLVSRRMAYFGAVFCSLSGAFYLYNAAMVAVIARSWPPLQRPTFVLHLLATLACGSQWLLCRSGRRSPAALNVIDIGGLLLPLCLFAALGVVDSANVDPALAPQAGQGQSILMALIVQAMVLTRAIIVPGTARRTFWLSSIGSLVSPLAAYIIMSRSYPVPTRVAHPLLIWVVPTYVGMWSLLTIAIATIASRVIYGLTQRVRAAHEVGQYTLEEKIGEGGMGVVYRARHALLRRPTAVKLLPSERAGALAVRRFEQEVQLTSSLTHPNTIAIYDFGHTPDGIFYYAMEYLDGVTLEELVEEQGPLPAPRVVHLLEQVASALIEAHTIGLIHRDIKPANLMLCVRGAIADQVKVLDFGLVKDFASTDPSLSSTGTFVGTPAYISPEAIRDPANVDARSDLYSLGAVGYYLLTGERIFNAKTVMEVCAHHLHSAPMPPSQRTDRAIPQSLESLVLACLSKDPAERPASARALVSALSNLDAVDKWEASDADRWWQQHAARVKARVNEQRGVSTTPGPRTVAIDLARRDTAAM